MKQKFFYLFGIVVLLVIGIFAALKFHQASSKTTAMTMKATNPLDKVPLGHLLAHEDIHKLQALFHDHYLTGGQKEPSSRSVRWVNPNTFIFAEFDDPAKHEDQKMQFEGIGTKGVYCAESQPDKSFTHFIKYDAPTYDDTSKLQPGDQGYWVSWVAVDSFKYDDYQDKPGIDYQYDKLSPPSCGTNVPPVSFSPPDAKNLTHDDIMALADYYNDNNTIFLGGQKAPRISKWVNPNAFIFLQFDNQNNVASAAAVRYLGLGVRGEFCQETQPSPDFPHLHMPSASQYAFGHASHAHDVGYWLMGVAVTQFNSNGRDVETEIDRKYNMEQIPSCNNPQANVSETPMTMGDTVIEVSGSEFSFTPNEIHLKAGQQVTIQFTNTGTMEHTFTIPDMHVDTAGLLPGHSKTITFTAPTKPGTYPALCTMGGHAQLGMKANVVVE